MSEPLARMAVVAPFASRQLGDLERATGVV